MNGSGSSGLNRDIKHNKLRVGEDFDILREQQNESAMEELWMDGPSIVDEEIPVPQRKKLRIL